MFLFQVIDELTKSKLQYALVGGYALALHGIVRATMDVDLVFNLELKDMEQAEKALNQAGLQTRLPIRAQDIIKMRKEYIENRNLIAWSFVDYKNPSRQVDIIITEDLKKLKTKKVSVQGRKMVVATLEELLRMKMAAGRPQDLIDVKKIKERLNVKKK